MNGLTTLAIGVLVIGMVGTHVSALRDLKYD